MSDSTLTFDDTEKQDLQVLTYLQHRMPAWPFEPTIDAAFVHELLDDFPDIDLLEEAKAFRWYYDNRPGERLRNVRLGLRRWINNAWTRR
jgi:hypothetical protein